MKIYLVQTVSRDNVTCNQLMTAEQVHALRVEDYDKDLLNVFVVWDVSIPGAVIQIPVTEF